ncbi:unnamed protein product [Rotaria sp. Silwood2]|nr:unnamed protein product [Rotaria sp. Silwood2]
MADSNPETGNIYRCVVFPQIITFIIIINCIFVLAECFMDPEVSRCPPHKPEVSKCPPHKPEVSKCPPYKPEVSACPPYEPEMSKCPPHT